MLTLDTTPLSANGRKPLALSRHLGLRPEIRLVDVERGEGQAPAFPKLASWYERIERLEAWRETKAPLGREERG
jgi:hypothetical protein